MRKLTLRACLGLVPLLLLWGSIVHAQEERVISDEEYEQVLNLLFPLNALIEPYYEFVTILRYKPSFGAEAQIVLIGREGYVQVIEYQSLDGNLYSKLSELLGSGELSPAEMASRVRVRKREIRVPFHQAQRWRRGLIDSINIAARPRALRYAPPPREVTIVTDGTEYELWDSSRVSRVSLHFSLVGGETHRRVYPATASFISWMEIVRAQVKNRN